MAGIGRGLINTLTPHQTHCSLSLLDKYISLLTTWKDRYLSKAYLYYRAQNVSMDDPSWTWTLEKYFREKWNGRNVSKMSEMKQGQFI